MIYIPNTSQKITKFFRLYPKYTRVYKKLDSKLWVTNIPPACEISLIIRFPTIAHKATADALVCNVDNEIESLIKKNILVHEIESDEEFYMQYALGLVDRRHYRLAPEIAAKYEVSPETLKILIKIESMIKQVFYNIHYKDGGQIYLELYPRFPSKFKNYQPYKFYPLPISKESFDELNSLGMIEMYAKDRWQLNQKYWELAL